MPAISTLSMFKALTSNGKLNPTISMSGTLNTDYAALTFDPIGIKGDIATFKNAGNTVAESRVLTHSQTQPPGVSAKNVSKIVLTVPTAVSENQVSILRNLKVYVTIESYNSATQAQNRDLITEAITALVALQDTLSSRATFY